jgi:hypothetical protein
MKCPWSRSLQHPSSTLEVNQIGACLSDLMALDSRYQHHLLHYGTVPSRWGSIGQHLFHGTVLQQLRSLTTWSVRLALMLDDVCDACATEGLTRVGRDPEDDPDSAAFSAEQCHLAPGLRLSGLARPKRALGFGGVSARRKDDEKDERAYRVGVGFPASRLLLIAFDTLN